MSAANPFTRARLAALAAAERTMAEAEEVTKYDELWVIEREDGLRWSASSRTWVTEESDEFTSWGPTDDVLAVHGVDLAMRDGGDWRNINEV